MKILLQRFVHQNNYLVDKGLTKTITNTHTHQNGNNGTSRSPSQQIHLGIVCFFILYMLMYYLA